MKFIQVILRGEYLEEIEGDLAEVFEEDLAFYGLRKARRRYALGAIQLVRLQLIKKARRPPKLLFLPLMRDLKLAYRSLLKFKGHTLINLIGLSLGLAMGAFTLQYVLEELSFDKFHRRGDRIFKVVTASTDGGMETNAWPVGDKLRSEFPEVEAVTYSTRATPTFQVERQGSYYERDFFFATGEFVDIFSFETVAGDAKEALTIANSMLITESMQDLYFKGEAIGRSIIMQDSIEYRIGAVIADPPVNTHLQFDGLISFATYEKLVGFSYSQGWGNFNIRNYLMLREGVQIDQVTSKAAGIYREHVGEWLDEMGVDFSVAFIPLEEVYLDSTFYNGMGPNGSRKRVNTLMIISAFLMLLACINYINLSTARSLHRAREVGIKKVHGSSRVALVSQFLIESLLLTSLSFLLAIGFVGLLLPFFNGLLGKEYTLLSFLNRPFLLGVAGLIPAVSLVAGGYPAWVISGFKPLTAVRGIAKSGRQGLTLRRALIAFQFFVSSGLVLATLLVIQQLAYMRMQDLGFDGEQVLVIDATNATGEVSSAVVKAQLLSITGVQQVSHTNALPGRPGWQGQWAYPERVSDEPVHTEYMAIDESYLSALGLELVAGRGFSEDRPAELKSGLILNETCVQAMGWSSPEEALGKEIVSPSQRPAGTVIGVVKDYHGLGLQSEIWPKAMDFDSDQFGRYYAVKFDKRRTIGVTEAVEDSWEMLYPNFPLQFSFLDQDFDRQYREEEQLAQVLGVFAAVIIIVSAIGLLGLISLVAASKTKEIGIRKTLGATIGDVVLLISRSFVLLVLIGNLLAAPFLWYFGNDWLNTFAHRVQIDPLLFIYALVVTAALAFLIVGYQVFHTARLNPVDALRDE
ncbi:MAG: FtsX-like permease family protein [Bacteroidota bacterium]